MNAIYIYTLQVHYTARFADGIVFDSSYKRARPLTMRIGVGKVYNSFYPKVFSNIVLLCCNLSECINRFQVIKGLDQGILGGEGVPPMRIGTNFNWSILRFFNHDTCHLLIYLFYPGGKCKLQIPLHLAYGPEPAVCFSGYVSSHFGNLLYYLI